MAGALNGFNNFLSKANETDLYAVYMDYFGVQSYNNTVTSTLRRRSLMPLEAINGQSIAQSTGFYQLCMDFATPNKRVTGGNSDLMFYITTDTANHTDLNTELTHRNPVIIAKSSLSNILNIRILDDQDAQITAVLKPVTGGNTTVYLEHVLKLTIKPVRV